jgi:chromosome segregation ATPase
MQTNIDTLLAGASGLKSEDLAKALAQLQTQLAQTRLREEKEGELTNITAELTDLNSQIEALTAEQAAETIGLAASLAQMQSLELQIAELQIPK